MSERVRALNRFGMGARPGDVARVGDARRWLLSQTDGDAPAVSTPDGAGKAEIAAGLAALRRAARGDKGDKDARRDARQRLVQVATAESRAAFEQRVTTDRPFVERLVAFWSNHLCVSSAAKLPVAVLAGSYEREVIRPHVFGKFEDMVLASARHPAMLIYLDNAQSIGPSSRAADVAARRPNARAKPGLNENYARELMELHTLGVNGGYTQQDVIELAKLLTGWTVSGLGPNRGPRGLFGGAGSDEEVGFVFRPQLHEPGARTLLGARYADGGEQEGERAIRTLCRHPSAATFIATKLVRHFVSDDPPQGAVERVARVFRESGGDLREVSRAVVQLPEAWDDQNRKFRTPQDWLVAVLRALDIREPGLAPVQVLRQLSHPLWAPAAPKGFGDSMAEWADPNSLLDRAELSRTVARRVVGVTPSVDPRVLLESLDVEATDPLRGMLSDGSISVDDRLALALAGPAFQWR